MAVGQGFALNPQGALRMPGRTLDTRSNNFLYNLAVGQGFEPWKPFRTYTLSKRAH